MAKVMLREIRAIESAHDRLGLTYEQVAQMLGADESTVHRWRAGVSEPSRVFLRQLRELETLLGELDRTFRTREAARAWLLRPAPQFGARRPLDLLTAGRLTSVTDALLSFNTGMTA